MLLEQTNLIFDQHFQSDEAAPSPPPAGNNSGQGSHQGKKRGCSPPFHIARFSPLFLLQATPLFGNVVDAVTSPFRGFLNLVGLTGASGEKEPEKKPSNSYGAPSYRPAPSYHAPAPAYHAPAPTYHAPAPAPAYHAPVVVHHAPKPEIHVLPAPDLSHGPGSYSSPAAPSVDTYGSPAAPSYSAPALDTYGSAASPPVYTPTSNDPAPVDVVTTVKLIEPPTVVEVVHPITNVPLAPLDPVVDVQEVETDELVQPVELINGQDIDISLRQQSDSLPEKEVSIVEFVNVKADVVDLRTAVPEEARQPKAVNGDSGKLNQVQNYIPTSHRFSVLPLHISG